MDQGIQIYDNIHVLYSQSATGVNKNRGVQFLSFTIPIAVPGAQSSGFLFGGDGGGGGEGKMVA